MKKRTLRKVLVTGASGFIGTHLVREMVRRGIQVYGTDRYAPSQPLGTEAFFVEDLVDGTQWPQVLREVDTVFHLAAIASIAREQEEEYTRVNVTGTGRVARLTTEAGIGKCVHMSSSTVYGMPERCPLQEWAPVQPKNPYSRSKAEAETILLEACRGRSSATIIRPRVVVGEGRAGIFGLLFSWMKTHAPIPLIGGGKNRFQFTAIQDLVQGTLLAAEEECGLQHQTYNLGCDVFHPLRHDIQALLDATESRSAILPMPGKPLEWTLSGLHRARVSPLVPEQFQIARLDFVLDTSRAKERLGFSPQYPNHQGLVDAWQWWNRQDTGRGAMQDIVTHWKPRYQNLLQKRGER